MPHNKNQHFVPQFYLRNFSTEAQQKTIHLYNISRGRSIFNIGISGQCYRHYFYGKDALLERALGILETHTSPLLAKMITEGKLPTRCSPQHGLLAQFIAIQRGRTEVRELEMNEVFDTFAKHVIRQEKPELATNLHKWRLTLNNVAIMNVQKTAVISPLLFDLEYKILITPNNTFLITADNPVAFANQYLDRSYTRFSHGFSSRGLQIYFPISPRALYFSMIVISIKSVRLDARILKFQPRTWPN
jgi:Protein of unknown function (DUF4238)